MIGLGSSEKRHALGSAALDSGPATRCCLFLDIDGTLLEIASSPAGVQVDSELVSLLRCLDIACDGALALVSGRPIVQVDSLFSPLVLPVAGVHGLERRNALGEWFGHRSRFSTMDRLRLQLEQIASGLHGVELEDKELAFALHFRRAPHVEEMMRLQMAALVSATPGMELLEGDHVLELKPHGASKGTAVEAFMQEPPFAGRVPVYLGDDITDLDGFAAVKRLNGHTVAVGRRVRGDIMLEGPAEVREWLARLVEFLRL